MCHFKLFVYERDMDVKYNVRFWVDSNGSVQWRALVNTALKLLILKSVGCCIIGYYKCIKSVTFM